MIEDRQRLISSLGTLRDVIDDVLERQRGFIDPRMLTLFRKAWPEVQIAFTSVLARLENAELDDPLARAGLTRSQLAVKVGGFERAFQLWIGRKARRSLRRLLEWADTILGSLAAVIQAVEIIREYKDCLRNEVAFSGPQFPNA